MPTVQSMRHKARDSGGKYALLLLLCRHIGLLFGKRLDTKLLRHRIRKLYPDSSVHKLSNSLRIFFFHSESGFKNVRIRSRILRMRVSGKKIVGDSKLCGYGWKCGFYNCNAAVVIYTCIGRAIHL